MSRKMTTKTHTLINENNIVDIVTNGDYRNNRYIVILPCQGEPYVWKNVMYRMDTKSDKVHLTREIKQILCVGLNEVEPINPYMLKIHPMFTNRWRIANDLLRCKGVEVFVCDDYEDYSPNMACLRVERDLPQSFTMEQYEKAPFKVSRTPYFGDVAMVIPAISFHNELGASLSLFRVWLPSHYERMGIKREPHNDSRDDNEPYRFEPNDDDEIKQFKKYATVNKWGLSSFGYVFNEKTRRDDEDTTEYELDTE